MSIIEIENRLVADRAEYTGPGADQSIRDREYLLGLVKAQQARIEGAVNAAESCRDNCAGEGDCLDLADDVIAALGTVA